MTLRIRGKFSLDLHILLCERNYCALNRMLEDADVTEKGRKRQLIYPTQPPVAIDARRNGTWAEEVSMRQLTKVHPDYPPLSLAIRLYHDFHVAEIIRFQGKRPPMPGSVPELSALLDSSNEKLAQNAFLNLWLQRLATEGVPVTVDSL